MTGNRISNGEDAAATTFDGGANGKGWGVQADDRERVVARLRVVWNRRNFIFRVAGAGLLLSTCVAFLVPKRFQSTARLMPPDQMNPEMALLASAATAKAGSGLGSAASDLLGLKSSGALFVGILQSRTVQDEIVVRFDLRKIYGDRFLQDARDDLRLNSVVSEDRRSGIITVQVEDRDSRRAAAIAQEYVDELNRVVTQVNTSSAHREREFLEERLAQVSLNLEAAESSFSDFASKNAAIDIEAQGKAMIEAAATLEGQLVAAQTEMQGLKQVFADGNVRVRATQARIDELQRQLQKLGGKFDAPAASGQDSLSMYPSIRKLPLLGVSYADLYRSMKIQEAVFETLTQQYELARVQEAKETPSVKLIDAPDVPEKKVYPPRLLWALTGTLVSVAGGIVWLFACAAWQAVEPEDPRKVFARELVEAAESGMGFGWQHGGLWQRRSAAGRVSPPKPQ